MEKEEISICIAGAGLGGLAVARLLQMAGFTQVFVYEKDTSIESRPQGYSLSIQQGGSVLRSLGLGPVLDATVASNSAYHTLNSNGETVLYYGAENPAESRGNNIPIPRQYLRQKLFELLQPNTVIWNSSIENFTVNPTKNNTRSSVDVVFSDGSSRRFTCLIGCDGIRSRIRQLLLGDEINYLGVMSIVGIAPTHSHPLLESRVLQILDGTQRVFIKPFNNETCMWQLTYPREEPDSSPRSQDWAKNEAQVRCKSWMEPIPLLIESTPPEKIRYAALYDREPISSKSKVPEGPVALVGDAAHPMSPFKGQGANQVLEDARDISKIIIEALESGESFEAAFKRFIPIMAKRSVPKVYKSRQHVKFYHQPSCIDQSALFAYLGVKETPEIHKAISNASNYVKTIKKHE